MTLLRVVPMAALLAACSTPAPAPPLPHFNIDPARISVSGLSSGAYMATQFHLAHADRIDAVALFAGGPYGCAGGDLGAALAACMAPAAGKLFDLDALVASARARAADGRLAPLAALQGDRVYVWHGSADATVAAAVSEGAAALYEQLGATVQRRFEQPFAHLLPVRAGAGDCTQSVSPYLGACGVDAVGEALAAVLAPLPAQVPEQAGGSLRSIDARVDGVELPAGADEQALLYVPAACAEGAACGLHIAFHGCEQGQEKIGKLFAEQAGYNRWADAAGLVVLYPQVRSSMVPLNPKGCWDWWGYSGPAYDTRDGAQIRWVAALARALGAPID